MRPKMWVFNSVGDLGHDSRRATAASPAASPSSTSFTQPGPGVTLFTRTMTIEAYRDAPLPDGFFRMVNPANIDAYHAAVARELDWSRTVCPAASSRCRARRSAAPWSANSCWLSSQSGSSESKPWHVPGNTCSSVATPAHISRSA